MSEGLALAPLVERWGKQVMLSAGDRSAIYALPHSRHTSGKDAYLVREGQEARDCSVLLRGLAFRQKCLRDGSRQIISFHVPGEFLDLQNVLLRRADHSVQSLNRTEVALIPRAALVELADARPNVRNAMWLDTLIDSSIFREWVVNVGRRHSRARIAHLLCELALRLRSVTGHAELTFDFPVTQEQLADATGMTSVHTNRTLQALRRDGLVQLTSGSLTVLDWDRLCAIGDFDDLYLHDQVLPHGLRAAPPR